MKAKGDDRIRGMRSTTRVVMRADGDRVAGVGVDVVAPVAEGGVVVPVAGRRRRMPDGR
jgi:hypothetical protein